MELVLKTSTDWPDISRELTIRADKLNCNKDARAIMKNIGVKVKDLGNAEIAMRRNPLSAGRVVTALTTEINDDIRNLEQLLFMAIFYRGANNGKN
jgi:hypothetical protein